MKKIFLLILSIFLFIGLAFAIGFHSADEILPGTFSEGNFIFNGSIDVLGITNIENRLQLLNLENKIPAKINLGGFGVIQDAILDENSFQASNFKTMLLFNAYIKNESTNEYRESNVYAEKNKFEIRDGDFDFYHRANSGGAAEKEVWTESGWSHLVKIDRSGNVGIGTTNPSYRLQVGETLNYGYVDATGAWQSSSDIRFKENIEPIKNALNKINQIDGIKYNTLNDSKIQIGFSAQEVEEVLPEIVSTDENGFKGVAYAKITPILVEAIKELKQENENLRKRVELLEN